MGCGASSAKYDKKIVPVPDDDIIDDNVADRDDGTGRLQSACTEVRVFWDVENMMPPTDQIKHVKNMLCEKVQEVKPGAKVTIVALMDTGEPSLQGQKPELTAAGVDVQCTRFNPMKEKEASDKAIIMHSLLWLHDNKGNDVAVMFVTADTDFTVLINKIRGYNIDVFLVTRMTDSARDLREAATQPVVDWQTLLRQAGPPAPAPPRLWFIAFDNTGNPFGKLGQDLKRIHDETDTQTQFNNAKGARKTWSFPAAYFGKLAYCTITAKSGAANFPRAVERICQIAVVPGEPLRCFVPVRKDLNDELLGQIANATGCLLEIETSAAKLVTRGKEQFHVVSITLGPHATADRYGEACNLLCNPVTSTVPSAPSAPLGAGSQLDRIGGMKLPPLQPPPLSPLGA